MSASDSPRQPYPKIRSDGWTAERQLRFLDAFVRTRSVSKAAAAAGMSREGAYRLRGRREGVLFAALWDRILEPASRGSAQVHIADVSDGRLARLLGNLLRREKGDFAALGQRSGRSGATHRT